jgi:outer membrane usher protein
VSELTESVLEILTSPEGEGTMLVVLRDPTGGIYLEEHDFEKLRLHRPRTAPREHDGHRYYLLTAIAGLTVHIDEVQQRVLVSAPAVAFDTTHLSPNARVYPPVTPSSPGAFLNYQISAQEVGSQRNDGALAEVGVFAGTGVITNTAVARSTPQSTVLVRLDSTYTHDFPDNLQTLDVGDSISDPGSWGNAVRFAGVRFAKNFALRPDLLTTPLLSTAGTATVPSTVDVFVNNQLATSSPLPAGPFIVDRLPTLSGAGDVSVVVRDALGREQVMTQSFYSTATLLAKDLTEYSVNVGTVRENYALSSDQYESAIAEVNYRRGITEAFTLEGHGEYLKDEASAAGVNAVLGVGAYGAVNFTTASGSDATGRGWLNGVGAEHRSGRFSFLVNGEWASPHFAQVGEALDPAERLRQRTLVQAGTTFGRLGTLSLALARESYRSAPQQQTVGLTQSVTIGQAGTINLALTRTRIAASQPTVEFDALPGLQNLMLAASPAQASTSIYLTYVVSLGHRRTASVAVVEGQGSGAPPAGVTATFSESPPVGPGSGYRVSASSTGNYDADWRQQFQAADVEVEAVRNQGVSGLSAYATGAVTFLGDKFDATRSVTGSFALVDVAGLANVAVYVENQLTAHTDASGEALLYNLRPYEANRISIEPEELPLDTAIAATSTLIAPSFRGGVIVHFPVERIRSATLRLLLDSGTPVPAGAQVKFGAMSFPVVLEGLVYVTGYTRAMPGQASGEFGVCTFELPAPSLNDTTPDLGQISCHETVVASAGTP